MNHRRLSMFIIVTLLVFMSQFIPLRNSDSVSAGSRCNTAGFIADVTVPDGSLFQPGAGFVKTWRLKNTGNCTWTRLYSLAFVSGDPLGATSSMTMPVVAPGHQVDLSLNMNAPTTPGHYRGYWKLADAHGVTFGLGLYGSNPFWVDINVSSSVPPSPNPPPVGGTAFDFVQQVCSARWVSGAGQLLCPSTDGDARGFALSVDHPMLENGIADSAPGLLVYPQNKYNGYIQGFFPEYTVQPGDHFQASVGCAHGFACYVTFRLDYQINNGAIYILWTWKEKNEGMIYQLDKDLGALAGKKVKFILTLLATGPATGDRALWGQPRILSAGYVPPAPTPTPPPTPIPQGNVTAVNTSVKVPDFVNCADTLKADLLGSITTDGPAAVTYHWELSGAASNTTAESTLVFTSASTQPANLSGYALNCGSYTARLVVTSPTPISAQTDFTLSIPSLLPIYDFNTFNVIGTLACSDVASYTWRQEACNGESGGCWISQTSLFDNNYAGFLRHDGNTICGMNIP
jgi:hypothetical protein